MTFAQKMRVLRDQAGLSEAKLAAAAGLPFPSVHSYGLGARKPSLAAAVKIARALGVTCEAFSDCEDIAVEEPAETPPAKRKAKALPVTPPASDLEQEGKRRHQETPKPPRGRKGK